jgi:hypothetical protein
MEALLVIEKVIDAAFKRRERAEEDLLRRMEIGKTSLDIKKGLRQEEREELVALRVAVEKWQYFLETAVFDFSMLDPATADVRTLYERDKRLFFAVRLAVVKTSTYSAQPSARARPDARDHQHPKRLLPAREPGHVYPARDPGAAETHRGQAEGVRRERHEGPRVRPPRGRPIVEADIDKE